MQPLYAFGDLLVEALPGPGAEEDGLTLPGARYYPGGACAGVAVAACRLGVPVHVIGQVGRDDLGAYLKAALAHQGIDTRYLRTTDAPTPLAVVFGQGDARHVQYYRNETADILLAAHKLPSPAEFRPGVLHVGSATLTDEHIRRVHLGFVDRCRAAGSRISFDVRLRKGLWPGRINFQEPIKAMLARADVVTLDRRDLAELWETDARRRLLDLVFGHNAQAVYLTDGDGPVTLITPDSQEQAEAPMQPRTGPADSPDAFLGALLACLCRSDTPDWSAALAAGMRAAALTASGRGAFPALPGRDESGG